ncbi:MAG: CocE/NonD family hydrolase, partial [Candidatus Thermoplasmatota archaeon]|nr:CocE/NonD family hydrolase [Candidatus Thermoplasmatota archaeon]
MRWELLLGLALLTTGIAGCIGTDGPADDTATTASLGDLDLPAKVHDLLPVEIEWIETTSDGKAMHTAVYRPDTDDPVGVFINFSPYWGDTAEQRGDNFAQYMIDEYVPRGFAVVLAAIRGTGHSEGCFQIAGDQELQDMHDVIDHFADVPWSNGNVAAGGKSYDSTPQNGLIAKNPHEALKGIFHVSGITDMYRYNYRQGVTYAHGTAFNTYYYLQGTDEYGASFLSTPTVENTMSEDPESLSRILDDAACTELPQMQASGIGSGIHGMKDAYWIERDWNRYIADTDWNGSIFFVHGLQDWNVKPDHILPWLQLLPEQIPVKGWLHQDTENNGHVYPMRADWNQTMLTWLHHTLNGADVPIDWTVQA